MNFNLKNLVRIPHRSFSTSVKLNLPPKKGQVVKKSSNSFTNKNKNKNNNKRSDVRGILRHA